MYKKPGVYILFFVVVVSAIIVISYYMRAQEMERTDPVTVADYVLKLTMVGDVDGLRGMMHPDKKASYTPFTSEKREQLQQEAASDREKIGKETKISEIREYATTNGKPAAVAKIRKKSGEVYVIVLTREQNIYYYDSFHTLAAKDYKKLTLIKKAK